MLMLVLFGLVSSLSSPLFAQPQAGSSESNINPQIDSTQHTMSTPVNAAFRIDDLDFRNTDIKDVMRAIAQKYKLNIFIDDQVESRVTIHLSDVSVDQAIRFMVTQAGLIMQQEDNIYKLQLPPPMPVAAPPPLQIKVENDSLTCDLKNEKLEKVIREISMKSGYNIAIREGVSGTISGFLQNIPVGKGLKILLNANGFELQRKENVYWIDWGYVNAGTQDRRGKRFWVSQADSLITLDVAEAEIRDVIQQIALQLGIDLIIYGDIAGKITAKCSQIPLDETLGLLFKGTNFTFRKEGDIYLVADKSLQGISSARLIRLQHLKADGLLELLPQRITHNAAVQVIKEHNGIMVIGTQDLISETEAFIRQIDYPIPQILLEALVIDFNESDISEFSLEAGLGAQDTSKSVRWLFPQIEASANGEYMNSQIALYGPKWGLPQVGKLPSDFFVRLKAMEREGKAKIRSRPQIATLNGHTASISIGTTQYFILKTQTPYSSTNQVYVQESQRFETIKAEMLLKITPWVSASGEITTEIHPEFSTPKGSLDPNKPPTIDHRILDSTVRLRDGETIILGGLIQDTELRDYNEFPLLSHIPLLGRLFKSYSNNTSTAELMIYLTPHLYYSESMPTDAGGYIR